MNHPKPIEVVAGILYNQQNEFLLSSRPEGKPYAGYWEFAGGKVEDGESLLTALQREFSEELGIHITDATPWLTRTHQYEHAHVHLHFFRIAADQWHGQLSAREKQSWSWQKPNTLTVSPMLPANAPILAALSIPTILIGNLQTGFHSPTPPASQTIPYIFPYHNNLPTETLAYIPAEKIAQTIKQHPANNTWAICTNHQQWTQAQSAAAVIWPIQQQKHKKQLLTLLQKHEIPLPILILTNQQDWEKNHTDWIKSHIHGVIIEQQTP